jgi:hypothetical protein
MSDPEKPSDAHDRRYLRRPTSWWTAFMRPIETVTPVPVSVTLAQGPKDFGWIDLTIRFGDQEALITMSEVYDPFSSLLAWLQAVHEGDLPIGIDIDEENEICRISAHPFSDRLLLISAFDRYFEKDRITAAIDRADLLSAIRIALSSFIRHEMDVVRWLNDGSEEGDSEVAEYRDRLLSHPFLR